MLQCFNHIDASIVAVTTRGLGLMSFLTGCSPSELELDIENTKSRQALWVFAVHHTQPLCAVNISESCVLSHTQTHTYSYILFLTGLRLEAGSVSWVKQMPHHAAPRSKYSAQLADHTHASYPSPYGSAVYLCKKGRRYCSRQSRAIHHHCLYMSNRTNSGNNHNQCL
jgi:hypothetical protein